MELSHGISLEVQTYLVEVAMRLVLEVPEGEAQQENRIEMKEETQPLLEQRLKAANRWRVGRELPR